ncbi:MAG: trypsin-like peptidase domain-containing protein, partial [Planctomycetes bacterium]|nr:trypsin-like peptidase domain-containing protein [Planctomycetota bacterium]
MRMPLLLILVLAASAPTTTAQNARADRELRRTPTVRAIERVSPAVVSIRTQAKIQRRQQRDAFFQFFEQEGPSSGMQDQSLGSGVIFDPKGYVVTNDHVIRQANRISIGLTDGRVLDARLVGTDSKNDIAVLKILGEGPFPVAPLGRDDDLMVGEPNLALGNPFGLDGSVTSGILSHTNRTVHFRGKPVFKDFLQTSAVINPGNSGGPLINILGEVIGVNVAIHSRGPGIGFAIPVSRVRDVVYNVLHPRLARRAWLGVEIDHESEAVGALVAEIDAESPAARAGVETGDLILDLNGERVKSWIDFQTSVGEMPLDENFEVVIDRGGRQMKRTMRLVSAPPSPADKKVFQAVGFDFAEYKGRVGDDTVQALRVVQVHEDSLASQIGVQNGDIILELANFRDLD